MSEKIDWKRRKVAEDEISAVWQEYTKLETQSEFENFSSLMDEDSFWPKIVELAEFCDEILEKNNLPKAMQSVRHDGGANWWLHPKDAPPTPPNGETWRIELGYSFVVRCFPDLSDKWFAATLGFRCREAISLRDRGKCESSSFLALIFEIARLRTDWVWRRKQKHNILRGKKVRSAASAGGSAKALESKDRNQAIIQEMESFVSSGHSVSRAANFAYKNGLGTSEGANRKLWDRHKTKS